MKSYRESHQGRGKSYDKHYKDHKRDISLWKIEQKVLDNFVKRRFSGKIDNYLDFACGTGRIIAQLEKYTINSVGIDISRSMIDEAKKKCRKSKLIVGDMTVSDFDSKEYDLITAFRFFKNAEHSLRKSAFDTLHKKLSSTGILIFNNHGNRLTFGRMFKALSGKEIDMLDLTFPERYPPHNYLKKILDDAGFKIIKTEGIGLIWPLKLFCPEIIYFVKKK